MSLKRKGSVPSECVVTTMSSFFYWKGGEKSEPLSER